jgi:hypothetical protein
MQRNAGTQALELARTNWQAFVRNCEIVAAAPVSWSDMVFLPGQHNILAHVRGTEHRAAPMWAGLHLDHTSACNFAVMRQFVHTCGDKQD